MEWCCITIHQKVPVNTCVFVGYSGTGDYTMDTAIRMKCMVCGHIYDPKKGDEGVSVGTAFADIPDEWCCPVCGAVKAKFSEVK